MTAPTPMDFEVRSDPRELRGIRERIRTWAAPAGWSEAQLGEIVLAIDEALTNVIEHAYGFSTDKPIQVNVRSIAETEDPRGGMEVRIRDFGKQVDPCCIRSRDLDDIRDGGLGVFLIHAMMSEVQYEPATGGGMLLVLRKYKDHTAQAPGCPTEQP